MKTMKFLLWIPLLGCVVDDEDTEGMVESAAALESAPNANGTAATISRTGNIDRTNVFFTFRANGRNCETCHDATAGWAVTPQLAQSRFESTGGMAPLFLPFDASNNPTLSHEGTEERRQRYWHMFDRGLARFDTRPSQLPANREFDIDDVLDSNGYGNVWLFPRYRRASSIANEALSQTLVAHGVNAPARTLLENISGGASSFHLQWSIDSTARAKMADFMQSLVHAQSFVNGAGRTDADGARGGVNFLAQVTFVPGANDPAKTGFNPNAFQLFGAWLSSTNTYRAAIARGERVFNTKSIGGVRTLFPENARPTATTTTCSTCHAVPSVGSHPVFRVFDIGTASTQRPGTGILPRLTVRRIATGEVRTVTDLGHALETGKWSDIGKFAVPKLRGLSSRPPYFHNGTARTLHDVVAFYEQQFGIVFSGTERADLIAFLGAL